MNNALQQSLRILAIVGMLSVGRAFAAEITLTPNQILRIDFQINGPFGQPPDVFWLGWEHLPVEADRIGARHAVLYHESVLVGENVETLFGDYAGHLSLNPSNAWRTADSLWNFNSAATVDFDNLFTESQSGHIDFFIETGRMSFNTDYIRLTHGFGTATDSSFLILPSPKITEFAIVPEPSVILLIGIATIAVFALRI